MKAKKQFGQNFLIDENVLDKISNAVLACEKDLIIEIGPGRGALTKKMINKKCNVLAYEIDTDLLPILKNINNENLTVKNIDILKSNISEDLKAYSFKELYIVGNLPYYITTPIIDHIIKTNIKHKSLTIMVQLEVANRFLATPKSKDYGYFTVYLQHYYNVSRVVDVMPSSFEPAPKVKSSVINLMPKENIAEMPMEYFDFLKNCFKEKRKTLKNNLKTYTIENLSQILTNGGLSDLARAEECSEEIFKKIYKNIIKNI